MTNQKPTKKSSLLRIEAILPFVIFTGLISLYSHFFLDHHLKLALELGGYHLVGAEVNINRLETSFFKARIEINQIELTNSDKPTHNLLVLGKIRFQILWDGLLRAKLIIEELRTEDIQIDSPRKKIGKVKPPPPPPKTGDDFFSQALTATQTKALGKVANQNADNALGGLSKILGGQASQEDILAEIKKSLQAETKINEVKQLVSDKQKEWQTRIQTLPKQEQIKKIETELKSLQSQPINTPEQAQSALTTLKSKLEELQAMGQQVEQTTQALNHDLKTIDQQFKSIEKLVQSDLKQINQYLKLPSIDGQQIFKSIIMDYIQPYLAKFGYYRNLAQSYMPPNLVNPKEPDQIDLALKPSPREKGKVYEFGRPGSYPLFWIKLINISSQANSRKNIGALQGSLTHVTSNQGLINQPTKINFKGDFPSQELLGVNFEGTFDNRGVVSKIDYNFSINQSPIEQRSIINSPELQVSLLPAVAEFSSQGSLVGFKDLSLKFKQQIKSSQFEVTSSNQNLKDSLGRVFATINPFQFTANIQGQFPSLKIDFDTDFGRLLGQGLATEVSLIFKKFQAEAEKEINLKLNQQKDQIAQQIKTLEKDFKAQGLALQTQIEAEKTKVETQKKQLESQVQNEVKNKVEQEVKKAAEELKKKFKLGP